MKIAMIGLGRMGGNMVRRWMAAGHDVVVYDATAETRERFAKETGAIAASSIADLAVKLEAPRIVWMMVPPPELIPSSVILPGICRKMMC